MDWRAENRTQKLISRRQFHSPDSRRRVRPICCIDVIRCLRSRAWSTDYCVGKVPEGVSSPNSCLELVISKGDFLRFLEFLILLQCIAVRGWFRQVSAPRL